MAQGLFTLCRVDFEVMLQQTQVKTMLPYYERWMQALPNVQALAEVDDNTLFKLWEVWVITRERELKKRRKSAGAGGFPQDYEGFAASWRWAPTRLRLFAALPLSRITPLQMAMYCRFWPVYRF